MLKKSGKSTEPKLRKRSNIDSHSLLLQKSAYELLGLLVQHGQCAEMAIRTTIANLGTEDSRIKDLAFELIKIMVAKGVGTETFLRYARENRDSPRSQTAIQLLAMLGRSS